jgi:hypothetical protein
MKSQLIKKQFNHKFIKEKKQMRHFMLIAIAIFALSSNLAFGQTASEQGAGEKVKQVKFYGIVENNTYKFTTYKQSAEIQVYRYDEIKEDLVYIRTIYPKANELTTIHNFEKGMFLRMVTPDNDGFATTSNIYWNVKPVELTKK